MDLENLRSPSLPHDNQWIEEIKDESVRFQQLKKEMAKVIVGNEDIITFMIIALIRNGHVLIEGVPGVAKTTMIKTLSESLGLLFQRIQFTPDLLPGDLIGTRIYNQKTQDFEIKKGPIFAHVILADEINRASAKVQAALLESMQERQVTIGSTTYHLDDPFIVLATQNPLEQEGTYRLPEAQVDRFMCKLIVQYPSKEQEKKIVTLEQSSEKVQQILTKSDIMKAQTLIQKIYVDESVTDYIVNLIFATRHPENYKLNDIQEYIQYGISPRGTLSLYSAARGYAFLQKRHFVTPEDVKAVAVEVLRHRLIRTYQAEAERVSADSIIKKIMAVVPAP